MPIQSSDHKFSPMLFVNRKTTVPDVLPSGQCLHGKDNADVTDHCQQMVDSCESIINRL